jgi:hypothetical protein
VPNDKLGTLFDVIQKRVDAALPSVLAMRDSSAKNIDIFTELHLAARGISNRIDVTSFTNCAIHVSVIGRDLSNFQLCVFNSWKDHSLTPTLISHFYLSTYEFMERWPKALSEKTMRVCLKQMRGDSFGQEIKELNAAYLLVRDRWWSKLKQVRNNVAGHYDADAMNLLSALADINFMSFIDLATEVNNLLHATAVTLTSISNEMQPLLRKESAKLVT